MKMVATPVEKHAFDGQYRGRASSLASATNKEDYVRQFVSIKRTPFYLGGATNAYRLDTILNQLFASADSLGRSRSDILILEAGAGRGELSVYLACLGFRVIGVEVSAEGCKMGEELASRIGVGENCGFIEASVEQTGLPDNSVDFIIGAGTLHHFIKYDGVPAEFFRIMKPGAEGFFHDPFQENPLYRLFHNKAELERLGDCLLTKDWVVSYFKDFEVNLLPTDWFVMNDKFFDRVFKNKALTSRRMLSKVFFTLDRKIPANSRIALFLSGSLTTRIKKRN